MTQKDHITVCICTYLRPKLLARLLSELQKQKTNQLFSYSILVVDNDHEQSGKTVVESFKEHGEIIVEYHVEPIQNIALARNKAVKNAEGDFIAFIDDDEFPTEDWLLKLYETIKHFKADGVLGPVKPHFEVEPPEWVIRGKLCLRESFITGTQLINHRDTRTGNVLLSKVLFDKDETPFAVRFGQTGGEDSDFFRKRILGGGKFIWCDEACVYETVPAQRLNRKYFIRRALLRGVANAQGASLLSTSTLKSVIATIGYTISLPVLLIAGHHIFMNYLIRDCDHLGKILAILGLRLVGKRSIEKTEGLI